MVVINGKRTTAIVIRHRGDSVTLVPMKSGKLSARTVAFDEFRSEWKETGYALSQALTTFLTHIMKWGASLEVVRGLEKLAARDRFVEPVEGPILRQAQDDRKDRLRANGLISPSGRP